MEKLMKAVSEASMRLIALHIEKDNIKDESIINAICENAKEYMKSSLDSKVEAISLCSSTGELRAVLATFSIEVYQHAISTPAVK